MGLALVLTARKLRPYFLSHSIVVRTNFPLKKTLGRMDVSGRMVKWAVELGQFDIEYEPRTAIKGQALAEFLQETIQREQEAEWKAFIDGSSNQAGSRARIMLVSPTGEEYEYAVRLTFRASNNEAEYEALIYALQLAAEAGANCLEVYSDSQLVVQQMKGIFETKDERMGDYCDKVRKLSAGFRRITLEQIPRSENERADFLARVGSLSTECESRKITILQGHPQKCEEVAVASAADDRRTDIIRCLGGYELPCRREQNKLVARSRGFCLDRGLLYKRGFTRPHLKCLSRAEGVRAIREVHEGCCGDHAGGRMLAMRLLRAGYFWPTMRKDSIQFVKACDKCQRYGPRIHMPGEEMTIMDAPRPFLRWGIDIVGPLPIATGQMKFLVVTIDYFSKWVEAEAVARITDTEIMRFIWQNICCRYGIPMDLVSDNGTQFNSARITRWCSGLGIGQRFAAVAHPQANGQVEVINRILMEGIKKRLEKSKGNWVEELHSVIWAHRTSPKEATGETPFALVHGSEAVIPLEIGIPSSRMREHSDTRNDEGLRMELDLIMERREQAVVRMEANKERIKNAYDKKVRKRLFQVGDLVLKQADALKAVGKMEPNWEGPYIIKKVLKGGAYELANEEEMKLPRPWNIGHLKKYFT
ncbi:PREDICTED: protein NYNRIN-like [Erythranthe guttata]|uniref:protein NYNRIN-like n=1 Tax=Erythranthe guttata TaxID=4155 RepID=UPI00064DFEA1|nr:PREDICTED: protein NYNRIN-like [Erythranthe guttata]|eukprot:XP_012840476.1 PREDICTED: protein NYNRIN-like [Erythranthe guttata]